MKKFFLFGLVGSVGFLVECAVLYSLKEWLGLYFARIVSFICAVVITWGLNRLITFKNYVSERNKVSEFLTYFFFMLSGGFVNLAIYAVLITVSLHVRDLPMIAIAAGSLGGMVVNYALATYLFAKKVSVKQG